MPTLTIRGFDSDLHRLLWLRAARHGRSMEAEARAILIEKLQPEQPDAGLGSRIHARAAGFGGAELELPRAAVFDE